MGAVDYDRKTTTAKAQTAAQVYARQLKALPACYFGRGSAECSKDATRTSRQVLDDLWWVVERLAPLPRNAFLYELGREMGGTRAFYVVERGSVSDDVWREFGANEMRVPDARTLNVLEWYPEPNLSYYVYDTYTGNSRPTTVTTQSPYAMPGLELREQYGPVKVKAGIIIVPITDYMVRDGELYTLSWSVIQETSRAKGEEGAVEVYVSAEAGTKVGMNFPVISFSFDIKTGIKRSQKVYSRDEQRSLQRSGLQVSKSFLLQKIARSVRVYNANGGYYDVETGYRLERREGGDPLGPFWPNYSVNGFVFNDRDSAYEKAEKQLRLLMEETAQEIAKRVARG